MFVYTIFVCIVLLIVWYKGYRSDYWKKQNIVQADGTIWKFIFNNCSLAEVFKQIYDVHSSVPNVGLFIGSKPALLVRDLENVQAVMATDFQSFYSRGINTNPNDVLADNVLFINEFGRWKVIRQKLSPVFTSLKLKNMFYIMERCARDFVEKIKEHPQMVQTPFDAVYTYTTASIAASVFGIDTNTKNTMDSPFIEMSRKSTDPSLGNNIKIFISNMFPTLFKFLDLKIFAEHETFFIGAVRSVLESRRKETGKRHDFIDICLEIQKQGVMHDSTTGYEVEPTVEVLAAQAFFFFIAGADTSANTIHFTLLELSKNPNILSKVHKELDEVFNSCDDNPSYDDIGKLSYLDMVINEAMRKNPTIGSLRRECTKDTTLPSGSVKLAKGDLVIIPVYGLHTDEKYFPNPEIFDPERFAPENVSKINNFSYLPFGEGNRICLGMRYARLQVKIGLAWLLRRFTLREQLSSINRFEPSFFSLRMSNARYDVVSRNK